MTFRRDVLDGIVDILGLVRNRHGPKATVRCEVSGVSAVGLVMAAVAAPDREPAVGPAPVPVVPGDRAPVEGAVRPGWDRMLWIRVRRLRTVRTRSRWWLL